MTSRRPERTTDPIYRSVLDNMAGGVMSLDSRGTVTTFNRAATKITGLPAERAIGRSVADLLMELKGADAFVDVVLDAVYDASTGQQRVVEASFGGATRTLSVATSYLRAARGGQTVAIGVVAVFNDITEIRELRETELRLAKEVEARHAELRDAFQELEDKNRELGRAAKTMGAVRLIGGAAVLTLLLGLGVYFWEAMPERGQSARAAASASVKAADTDQGNLRTTVVKPRPISSSVTVAGRLAPRREIEVTSPIRGTVAAVHAHYGERVVEGQPLVDLDVSTVEIELREAQVAYIRARDRVTELTNWSDHVDVSRARRAVSRSRTALETRRNRLAETDFLLERGIIPASERKAAEREYRNQELDLQSAEEDLRIILAKGKANGEIARLELENARVRLNQLQEIISRSVVTAPVAGVVMLPGGGQGALGTDQREQGLATGTAVKEGDLLLLVGDLNGVTVTGEVDEVDIASIRPGQPARVVGDAFPGITLRGRIDRVSSQAKIRDDKSRLPYFEVTAVVDGLTEEQRERLRFGMSADLEVTVYKKSDALLVPIHAVQGSGDRARLRIRDRETGEVRPVKVTTGVTTLNSVEIVSGIAAGDEIVVGRTAEKG